MNMIYADHAATTRLSDRALEAMLPWLREGYGNPSQPYSFSRGPRRALREARAIIAACIHAYPEEIYFTSGGTESDNWAIKGAAFAGEGRRRIITSAFEHHAVLNACAALERQGWPVIRLMPDAEGVVRPEALEQQITGDSLLVSVMLANNELGTLQPIEQLGEIVHRHGALLHTDAVQAVGHIPIDVNALAVDMLSASAHKFNGPRGVGFLYIRKGTPIVPYADGGAQESGLRAGTENVAGIVGMAAALAENVERLSDNRRYLDELAQRLLSQLRGVDFQLNCCNQARLPGLLSLSFPGREGEALLHRLDLLGICVSTGSACDSKRTNISHVLRAIGLDERAARGTIRISLGRDNTRADVDAIAAALRKIAA